MLNKYWLDDGHGIGGEVRKVAKLIETSSS